ncbi:hypothetical protein C5167_011920 [Papaver somniferum]|uniref:FBD domain-containing protein n=1 Tax=Papaver somniferum TaxID=3469 RepID=A0A4Y7IW09_PAPSO|nr:hypothetical protein C5167_011920 [Papaver somniferum]
MESHLDLDSDPRFQFPDWDNPSETIKFTDFVDRTLLLHDFSSIKKFSLHWYWSENHLNACKINSWISAVIKHKVEEISLFLHQLLPGSIPLALFTCKSLVTLELNIQPNICLPEYISFPRLKRLKLCDVKFNDEWSNEQLFSSCLVLEDLVLKCCTFHMKNFCISIPALKLLTFENHYEQEDCLKDCSLGIHAPSLIFLTYLGGVPKEFILSAFPTLVEAQVSFLVDEYEYYYGQTWEQRIGHAAAISGFLRALEHVKHLSISDETLQALSFADDRLNNLPTFHNVKQLTITEEVDTDEILYAVLKATPNVESLIFDRLITPCYKEENEEEEECDNGNSKSAGDDDGVHNDESEVNHDNEANNSVLVEGENNQTTKNDGWELDMVHIGHLFLHLKSVCFQQFIGKAREMRWVKLILKNAKPLQTMIISCGTDTAVGFINPKSKEELMVEIPSFARASSSCVFKFSSFIDD